MADVTPLLRFMEEREAVRLRKQVLEVRGEVCSDPWPETPEWGRGYWTADYLTDDPILRQYRFCNVRREDDRVTRWVRGHLREPYADHPHLWLMLAIARTINWPPTLDWLMLSHETWPYDDRFHPVMMGTSLERRKLDGFKVYTGAYLIRAESDPAKPWFSWSKQRYIAEVVLGWLWKDRYFFSRLLSVERQHLQVAWQAFQPYTGWGPFMAYQVVVDMRHTRYLRDAPDINTWAALGPGSRRGLNRLHGRPVAAPLSQEQGLEEMLAVRKNLLYMEGYSGMKPWLTTPELSDVQNCLCEWDKYERVRLGQGRPRALYVAGRGW